MSWCTAQKNEDVCAWKYGWKPRCRLHLHSCYFDVPTTAPSWAATFLVFQVPFILIILLLKAAAGEENKSAAEGHN